MVKQEKEDKDEERKIRKEPERRGNSRGNFERICAKTREEMDMAMKDVFGPMFEALLQGEINGHLGYENNDHGVKRTENRRNGYIGKELKTTIEDNIWRNTNQCAKGQRSKL